MFIRQCECSIGAQLNTQPTSHVEAHIALLHVLGVTIIDLHYDLLWIELYTHCLVSSTFHNNFSFHHHENIVSCPLSSCFDNRHFCKVIKTARNTKRHIRDITIISHLKIYIIHQTQYQPSTGENLFNAIDSMVNIAPVSASRYGQNSVRSNRSGIRPT